MLRSHFALDLMFGIASLAPSVAVPRLSCVAALPRRLIRAVHPFSLFSLLFPAFVHYVTLGKR